MFDEVVITPPEEAPCREQTSAEVLNGFDPVRSGSARMGCTVSFICCEEDFLQMPVSQHDEEKKKESLNKVSEDWPSKRVVLVVY